jgi:hypothetical protein
MTRKVPIGVRLSKFQLPISQPPWNCQETLLLPEKTPDFLLHVSPQVTLLAETDREYFASIAGT